MTKNQVIVRMTDEQKEKLQAQAKKANRSMTSYIVELIDRDAQMISIPTVGIIKDGRVVFGEVEA